MVLQIEVLEIMLDPPSPILFVDTERGVKEKSSGSILGNKNGEVKINKKFIYFQFTKLGSSKKVIN